MKKVAETKEKTKQILSKQAVKIAKQAEEHESFINKVYQLAALRSLLFTILEASATYLFETFMELLVVKLFFTVILLCQLFQTNCLWMQLTHLLGVLGFGGFCFVLGASEYENHHILEFCLFCFFSFQFL